MAWASDKTNGQGLFKEPCKVRQWIISLHKTFRIIHAVEESHNVAEIFDSLNFNFMNLDGPVIIDRVFVFLLPPPKSIY